MSFTRIKEGVTVKHCATKDADFIVPDSRAGWVKLLERVLNAYYVTGESFTYSTILRARRGRGRSRASVAPLPAPRY